MNCEGAIFQLEALSYWTEYVTERMQLDLAESTVPFFKDGGSNVYETPSIADQRAFVTAEIAEVEEVCKSACLLSRLPCLARI